MLPLKSARATDKKNVNNPNIYPKGFEAQCSTEDTSLKSCHFFVYSDCPPPGFSNRVQIQKDIDL
jgi:hypothetical protein